MLAPLGPILTHEQLRQERRELIRCNLSRNKLNIALAEHLLEQLLLATEITADQRDIDTGITGNFAKPDVVVAFEKKALARRLQYCLTGRCGVLRATNVFT